MRQQLLKKLQTDHIVNDVSIYRLAMNIGLSYPVMYNILTGKQKYGSMKTWELISEYYAKADGKQGGRASKGA